VLSIAGVMLVLCRGDWHALANVHLVLGDVFVLIATLCWAWYSITISTLTRFCSEATPLRWRRS
jgi:drug/metabolite transporter (DMT)-like permease